MFLTSYSCVFLLTRWTRAMVMFSIFSTYRCLIIDTAYMPTGFLVLRSKTFFWNFTITNTIIMTMRLPGWRTRIAIDINCTPSLRKSKTCSWKVKMCSRGRHGRDRIVVGLTTTYAIGAYHHWCCEFKSRYFRGVQHCTCMALVVRRYETMFSWRSHISRRFVYPKKKYDFLEKYDFFGWIKFHISLQQGPYIVYYTEITHTATICSQ